MDCYLSVDSGGTKTGFVLTDASGVALARLNLGSRTYPVDGLDGMMELFRQGVDELLRTAGASPFDIRAAAWGVPFYGEYPEIEQRLPGLLADFLPGTRHAVCNDVELGMCGSLALDPGIHIVAGTGSIAMGRGPDGATVRAGGGHEDFSDEGSGYWLSLLTLNCFTKQSDGRLPRGALYDIIREEFKLDSDFDIQAYYEQNLKGSRDRVARVQFLLERATLAGDRAAAALYERAAGEFMAMAAAVKQNLVFGGGQIKLSYSGGVFKAGELILGPLRVLAGQHNMTLTPPVLPPLSGGILLAARTAGIAGVEGMIETLVEQENKK